MSAKASCSSLSSEPLVEVAASPQLLKVPGSSHTVQHSSRGSSCTSSLSSRQGRHGGLRRRRISQCKMAVLRDPHLTPKEKLKRFLKSVRIIVEVCLALKRYVKKKNIKEPLTLMQMQLDLQDDLNKKLSFNPHYYSSSYVANKGSSKLKKLLAISPAARTKRHVKMIHTLVQNKAAFSKHPLHIRMKMCQVMIYQTYEARRAIIKQGHPPSAFYIILSGTCLINAREIDEGGAERIQTVNELREGEVFGEVALLNKTARTASVICKSDVELLVIYREDFDAIIRGPLYKQREGIIDFCKKIPILLDWPVDLLSSASIINFHFQYYRQDSVVVGNNWTSSFLVFIKSGECRVVCTLDGKREHNCVPSRMPRHTIVTSKITLPLIDNKAKMAVLQFRSRSLASGSRRPLEIGIGLPSIFDESVPEKRVKKDGLIAEEMANTAIHQAMIHQGIYSHFSPAFQKNDEAHVVKPLSEKISALQCVRQNNLWMPRHDIRRSIIDDTPYGIASNKNLSKTLKNAIFHNATLSHGLGESNQAITTKPRFAEIATLSSGCVFGLEEMMKRTELRLSLVSSGAECLFVSKKLFQKHATPRTLRCLHTMIGRYPTEAFIRLQLSKQEEWNSFRKNVVTEVLNRRSEKNDSIIF